MTWSLPFLIAVGVLLPWLAWSSHRHLAGDAAAPESLPSPSALAVQTILVQAVVATLAWLALTRSELELAWSSSLDAITLAATVVFVLAFLALARMEARRPRGPGDALRRRLRGVGLSGPWLAAMCAAAIGEEFAYRGVLVLLLSHALAPALAALASAVLFGLAHFGQGWRGVVSSAAFGLGLQAIVVSSGGLWLAVAAHLLYDLGAAWLGHRLSRMDEHEAAT